MKVNFNLDLAKASEKAVKVTNSIGQLVVNTAIICVGLCFIKGCAKELFPKKKKAPKPVRFHIFKIEDKCEESKEDDSLNTDPKCEVKEEESK